MRRTTQVFVTMLAAAATLLAVGSGASASGKVAGTSTTPGTVTINLTAVPHADSPEILQLTDALQAGQQVVLQTTGGRAATLALNNEVIEVRNITGGPISDEVVPFGFCASSVAFALFSLGAIALGALAAAGVGVVIAGFLFTPAMLGGAAAVSGGLAAYYAWAETHLCN
jgi:hypothetical protein